MSKSIGDLLFFYESYKKYKYISIEEYVAQDPKVALQELAKLMGAPYEEVAALQRMIEEAATSDPGMPPAIVAGLLFGEAQTMIDRVESVPVKRASLLACINNAQAQLEVLWKKHGYVEDQVDEQKT